MTDKGYKLTVGLEVHAELNTRTKMFCDSKNPAGKPAASNGAGDPPNVDICPVCMGHPGTLPVINKEAVKSILRLGTALGGKLADYTEFDRKNYFYPDIPKGYQLSQYKHPLVSGGELSGVKLTRIHLEEDTARSTHDKGEYSLVDFNRAGVPLMELVTEPVITSAEQAAKFAKELQLLLNYLGVAEANMEKGEMRIEANISVSKIQDTRNKLGTKVEVKNLNSFKAVEKAINFEYERQVKVLEEGGRVVQETRGWNDSSSETFSQRLKEESHDYRYFPDPDLPKLIISEIPEFNKKVLEESLPELPWQKRERLLKTGIAAEHVEIYIINQEMGEYFEEVSKLLDKELVVLASNYITSELKTLVDAKEFAEVVKMINAGEISSRGAKEILKKLQDGENNSRAIAEQYSLMQISDKKVLKELVMEIISKNKNAPINFLMGEAMKKSQGRANPVMLQKLFVEMSDR